MDNYTILTLTGAILILPIAVLILRFCSAKLQEDGGEI